MKILIIQQKMIGDVLVSSMLLEEVKLKYPQAEVHYLVNKNTIDVLLHNPFVDKMVILDPKKDKGFYNLVRFGLNLRKEKYDVVIDVYVKIGSSILSFLSGAKKRIAYQKNYSKIFYTHLFKKTKSVVSNMGLTIEERLGLLQFLGIKKSYKIYPKIYITDDEKVVMKKKLRTQGVDLSKKTFMMSIIGSTPNKTYPLEYMSKLVDWVANTTDCNILFNYIPNQIEDAKKIYDVCKKSTQEKVYFDVLGKSLREFIVIMSCCDAIIGNDGGAINMAKALDKPSYIVFSPWINKNSWNTFEDGVYHKTVHLKDVKPAIFEEYSKKEIKESVFSLYKEFEPRLFKEDFMEFLDTLKTKDLDKYQLKDSIIIN